MFRRTVSLICGLTVFLSLLFPAAALATAAGVEAFAVDEPLAQEPVSDQIIVQFEDGTSTREEFDVLNELDIQQTEKIDQDAYVVQPIEDVPIEDLVEQYEDMQGVAFAEPDYKVSISSIPNDYYYTAYQTDVFGAMRVIEAWDITVGDPGIIVAVLDTGADYSHPDLSGQLLPGYDFVNNDSTPSDDNDHGTMCSGIIAANINNTVGVAGAADVSILPVKVLDAEGSGYVSEIIKGIQYAVENGADVISMSLGTTSNSQSLQSAVNDAYAAGVVLVAASGNSNSAVNYPAACDNVIAVGALEHDLTKASYSCFGSELDITAIGSYIASTAVNNAYKRGSGTSFAAPYAAALAALLLSADPALSPSEVESFMTGTAIDLGDAGRDAYYGFGCVDYYGALSAVTQEEPIDPPGDTPDVTPPVITLNGSSALALDIGSVYTDAGATAQDAVDGDLTAYIVTDNPVDTSTLGEYTVTYTVSDAAGNIATAIRTVTVKTPNSAPVLTLRGSSILKVALKVAYKDAGATAYDAEDGDITAKIVTAGSVNTAKAGTYKITYTVKDLNGVTATAARTVIVYKNTRPSIQLVGSSKVTLSYGDTYVEAGAKASDVDDGDLTAAIKVTGSVNTRTAGTYRITYSVTDSGGISTSVSRSVVVKKNSTPSIKLVGSKSIKIRMGSTFIDPGATATDAEEGVLTSKIVKSGTVNTLVAGTYKITYTVQDKWGFTASVMRSVVVEKNAAPVIKLIGSKTVTLKQGSSYVDAGATATDAEDGVLTSSIIRSGTVNTMATGTYYITYQVTDRFGATATATRTVKLK